MKILIPILLLSLSVATYHLGKRKGASQKPSGTNLTTTPKSSNSFSQCQDDLIELRIKFKHIYEEELPQCQKDLALAEAKLQEQEKLARQNNLKASGVELMNIGQSEADSSFSQVIKAEAQLEDAANESEKKIFLDRVAFKNLFDHLKSAGPINSQQLEVINGLYAGNIFLLKRNEIWDIEMQFNGEFKDGDLVGKASIEISKDGEVFSNSKSDGKLDNVNSLQKPSKAFLIRTGPGQYLQLYYLENTAGFIGNSYKQKSPGQYEREGTVVLNFKR